MFSDSNGIILGFKKDEKTKKKKKIPKYLEVKQQTSK